MRIPRVVWIAAMFVGVMLGTIPVAAQDFALTRDSEVGFQRLIRAAQTGLLGDDIVNANVGVLKTQVRIELVRKDGTTKELLLTHKDSPQTYSRFFNVEVGAGASAMDAGRVGQLLDEAFGGDPFVVGLDFFGFGAGDRPTLGLAEAWKYGSWKSVLAVLARRCVAPRGVRSTVAVLVALGTAVLACLVLLWTSGPSDSVASHVVPQRSLGVETTADIR